MNKLSKILVFIGITLIIASGIIIITNNYEDNKAKENSKIVLKNLKDNIKEQTKDKSNTNIKPTSISKQDNTIKIDNNKYIGIITIPKLNIELPIMSNYNEEKLKIAPCLYYGTISNKIIICAHSYRSHFGTLSKLSQNDKIVITNVDGENIIYEVLEIEVLDSNDIKKMINTEFDLTLYTCTNDGTKRITVRANKV